MPAVPRPNWTPPSEGTSNVDALAEWLTNQRRLDPNYEVPDGYEVGEDGTVRRTQPAFMYRHPWLFPVAGVTAGAALGPMVGASAASAAPAASEAITGGTMPGLVSLTQPAASSLPGWLTSALPAALPIAGRLLNRGGGSGNNMIQTPPQLTQLLDEATRRTMNQGPLSDAITRQALAGLPNYAR